MRIPVTLTSLVLLVVAMSGCIIEPGLQGTGTDCSASPPLQNGFKVAVPATLGEGTSQVDTVGWCVRGAQSGGSPPWDQRSKVDASYTVWISVPSAGTFHFHLSIPTPNDPYCAHTVEAFGIQHSGSGVVAVQLVDEGIQECA